MYCTLCVHDGGDMNFEKFIKHKLVKPKTEFGGRLPNYIPDGSGKETHPIFHFRHVGKKPSVYVKDTKVDDPTNTYLECPACSDKLPDLDHADYCVCGECGLNMQLFGAGLTIWR